MAFFAYLPSVIATAAMSAAGASAFRIASASLRRFLLSLFAVCALNLFVITPRLFFELTGSVCCGAVAWTLIAVSDSFTMCLHFPSIVALGVDENLERHGVLITTSGHVIDLVVWAIVGSLAARFCRASFRRRRVLRVVTPPADS